MEVRDLRNIPITELTAQEIAGRLALISDRMKEIAAETSELHDMYGALVAETKRRVSEVANVLGSNSGSS